MRDSHRVHLVGSVPFTDAAEVFREVATSLGEYVARIPDGETGERTNWVGWQLPILLANPNLELAASEGPSSARQLVRLAEGAAAEQLALGDIGYADAALASYETFKRMKAAGEIGANCLFQVCLPTPLATTHLFVDGALQADFEPQYEAQMLDELRRILEGIPASELAIQWDTAVEFGVLEGVFPTFLADPMAGVVERLLRLGGAVPTGVQLGFHLCYGDAGHQHFCEPRDMALLVAVANAICGAMTRSVEWIHMPVPRDRDDEAYFAPLDALSLQTDTDLYLGVVHHTDGLVGAQRRLEAARKYVSDFGVATECGFGRRPVETIADLFETHKRLV